MLNLIIKNKPFFGWSSVLTKLSHHADTYEEFEGCLKSSTMPNEGVNVDLAVIPIVTSTGVFVQRSSVIDAPSREVKIGLGG